MIKLRHMNHLGMYNYSMCLFVLIYFVYFSLSLNTFLREYCDWRQRCSGPKCSGPKFRCDGCKHQFQGDVYITNVCEHTLCTKCKEIIIEESQPDTCTRCPNRFCRNPISQLRKYTAKISLRHIETIQVYIDTSLGRTGSNSTCSS